MSLLQNHTNLFDAFNPSCHQQGHSDTIDYSSLLSFDYYGTAFDKLDHTVDFGIVAPSPPSSDYSSSSSSCGRSFSIESPPPQLHPQIEFNQEGSITVDTFDSPSSKLANSQHQPQYQYHRALSQQQRELLGTRRHSLEVSSPAQSILFDSQPRQLHYQQNQQAQIYPPQQESHQQQQQLLHRASFDSGMATTAAQSMYHYQNSIPAYGSISASPNPSNSFGHRQSSQHQQQQAQQFYLPQNYVEQQQQRQQAAFMRQMHQQQQMQAQQVQARVAPSPSTASSYQAPVLGHVATPSPNISAPVAVAPAFETAQGTFYFVPSTIGQSASTTNVNAPISNPSSEFAASRHQQHQVSPVMSSAQAPSQHIHDQPRLAASPLIAPVARRAPTVSSSIASGLALAATTYPTSSPSLSNHSRDSTASPVGLVTKKATAAPRAAKKSSSPSNSKKGLKSARRLSNSSTSSNGKDPLKRFICPYSGCGRAFARNFNMQSHLKSHLGIREFSCPACPKKFSRRHDRARHCVAVHDLDNVDDEPTSSTSSSRGRGGRKKKNFNAFKNESFDEEDAELDDELFEEDQDDSKNYRG